MSSRDTAAQKIVDHIIEVQRFTFFFHLLLYRNVENIVPARKKSTLSASLIISLVLVEHTESTEGIFYAVLSMH